MPCVRHLPRCTDCSPRPYEEVHRALARRAAEEGIILLKNENHTLPLPSGCRIALYGTGALHTLKGGTGSGDVNARETVSIRDGLYAAGFQIANEAWLQHCDTIYRQARSKWRDRVWEQLETGQQPHFFAAYVNTPFQAPACAPAKAACDAALYVLSRSSGEGADRKNEPGDYLLSKWEMQDLRSLCSFYPSVILVLNTGGIVDLSVLDELPRIHAVLLLSQPGMEGGNALADVLRGAVSPSGRLTDCWPLRLQDCLCMQQPSPDPRTVRYHEGIFVGYRYFDTFDVPVRFGFGDGLSYTQFSIQAGCLRLERGNRPRFVLDCTVQNTGGRWSAKEVMQLYATCPCALQPKEYRRLVAFAKTGLLAPGQKQTLALEFSPDALASFDPQAGGWVLDAKTYGLWLGNSLQSCRLIGGIQLEQREVLEQVSLCWPDAPQDWFSPGMKHCLEKRRSLEKELLQQGLPILPVRPGLLLGSARSRPHPDPNAEKALAIASQLDDDSLVRLCVGQWHKDDESQLGSAGVSVPGSAGETQEIGGDIRVPSLVLADGPAGLRLASCYFTQKGQPLIPPLEQCFENGFLARGEYNPGGTRHYQYCTAFPIGTMLAQSWNTCLLQEVGAAVGYEMALFGVSLWLAPGMNIHRSPLCGRNFEYFSEDPLLSGQMAAAITRGVQSCPGCGVTLKHFACNNQETERLESNSLVSERALREIYLRGFQIAVQSAQPSAIMTSYNLVNGVHAANSAALCTAIARCEWGFAGIFMTDWDTTSSRRCTAEGCIQAGNDLLMPGNRREYSALLCALRDGRLDRRLLRSCAGRIIKTALGLSAPTAP